MQISPEIVHFLLKALNLADMYGFPCLSICDMGPIKNCDFSKWQPFKTRSDSYKLLVFFRFLLQA